jgi:hypothetical protein
MTASHARPRRWRGLRTAIVILAALLAPVFFADMFITVVTLVRPSFGWWAWTVPAATEGSFVVLYLLDLLLQWAGKPMGWLRFAPYPFAAASLLLNVYAARGNLPASVGHAVVTIAFFLPLLAGEAAVRSLSASADDIAWRAEHAAARRYAMDLVRDQKGILWRWRIPSLLRTRIVRGRFPATVATAVRDGAQFGGAAKWELAVEQMVTDALTQGARMAATVKQQKRQIERQAAASDEPAPGRRPVRQPRSRKTVSVTDKNRAEIVRLLSVTPSLSVGQIAGRAGCSERTVGRVKKEQAEAAAEAGKPRLVSAQ